MSDLLVPHRFRGPDTSGNGGWTAGALAQHLIPRPSPGADPATSAADPPPAVRVTLRKPPPLETPMRVDLDAEGGAAQLLVPASDDDTGPVLVAEATLLAESDAPTPVAPRRPVDPVVAHDARAGYPGLRSHPFPGCFACGTDRAEDDGLRIFPGPVAGADDGAALVASTWTPHPDLPDSVEGRASWAVAWAALDCVGGWAGDLTDRMMVLGRMSARVLRLPRLDEEHVVVGTARGAEGRRTFTAATLYDAGGEAIAWAEHVWVAVDPATFGRTEGKTR